MPISLREWKGEATNPYVVPDTQNDMLWNDIKKHFTLLEDVEDNLVKGWTLSKMVSQVQNFKKKLARYFIKKGRTPD